MKKHFWSTVGVVCSVLARKRRLLVTLAFIQIVFSCAIIWGIPLVLGSHNEPVRVLAASWHLGLLSIGLAVAPQVMAEWKIDGYFDELKQFPVSRFLLIGAELFSWVLVAVPGIICTPLLSWVGLNQVPKHVFETAALLVVTEITYIGIGLILVLALSLEMVQVISQVLMVGGMLFSPILYPPSRLPEWVQIIHSFLPFEPINSALVSVLADDVPSAKNLVAMACWFLVVTLFASVAMANRRHATPVSVLCDEEK